MKNRKYILIDAIFPKIENRIFLLLKDVILIFSFALLTGICAKIKFEIGIVPVTMQTFAVLLSGAILGKERVTFGYILGFVICAFCVGWLFERGWGKRIEKTIFAFLIGNLSLYFPGILWLAKFLGPKEAILKGFYPFIFGDFLKILLAGLTFFLLSKTIKNAK